jgi:tetratricopeptide (TPR) repeat protein
VTSGGASEPITKKAMRIKPSDNPGRRPESREQGRPFLMTVGLVVLAIVVLFAIDTFLAKTEKAEMRAEAARLFVEGQRFMTTGNHDQAIDRFESALAMTRDSQNYGLALAEAQFAAGRLTDAEMTVDDLLQRDSTDGPANLLLARIFVKEGKSSEATAYYHRAIYGHWQEGAAANQSKARFELIDLLARQNSPESKQELLAELLPLETEVPDDLATQKRIGHLFVVAGSPARAEDVFREILRREPQDADAYTGIGEAEFARGNYRTAKTEFLAALRLNPGSDETQRWLGLTNQVLDLDPMQRGVGVGDRNQRSLKLLELNVQLVTQCAVLNQSPELRSLIEDAQKALNQPARNSRQAPAVERNIDLAEKLWQARLTICKQNTSDPQDPLALVMNRLVQ